MTRKRNDTHSTEFGLWLREQKEISSEVGFIATNLDYIWSNYKTKEWMLIEEKRYKAKRTFVQCNLFSVLHNSIKDSKYKGFHVIQFEKTSPQNGKIYLDGKLISKQNLIKFLQFKLIFHK